MPEILFIQGAGPDTHTEWDIHLVESLRRELGPSYDVRYPRMPDEADPRVATWRPAIERELAALQPGAIVVGHSVGGTILIHTLADAAPAVPLGAIVLLAAPFIGKGGWPSEEIVPRPDLAERLPPAVPIFLYHGAADAEVPVAHVNRYADAIPHAHLRRLAGYDHQLNNDLSAVAGDIREVASGRPVLRCVRFRRGNTSLTISGDLLEVDVGDTRCGDYRVPEEIVERIWEIIRLIRVPLTTEPVPADNRVRSDEVTIRVGEEWLTAAWWKAPPEGVDTLRAVFDLLCQLVPPSVTERADFARVGA